MIESSRRSFLKGLFTVTAVAVAGIPEISIASLPKIVGDGVHDDWAGLQACLDGKPFVCENQAMIANDFRISGGEFWVTNTLEIRKSNFTIDGCKIKYPSRIKHFISVIDVDNIAIKNCIFVKVLSYEDIVNTGHDLSFSCPSNCKVDGTFIISSR